jgi:large subunit ribosomal protein L27
MSTTKSSGSTSLGRDSQSKRLGVKIYQGQKAKTGDIIIRQRGTKYLLGKNVGLGKDYTIFALKNGFVNFKTLRKTRFDGKQRIAKVVNVVSDKDKDK